MSKRTSPKNISNLEDLTDLKELIVDKRAHKRADSKKNRRNRHYEKVMIKAAITRKNI